MDPGSVIESKILEVMAKKSQMVSEVNGLKEWASKLGIAVEKSAKERKKAI